MSKSHENMLKALSAAVSAERGMPNDPKGAHERLQSALRTEALRAHNARSEEEEPADPDVNDNFEPRMRTPEAARGNRGGLMSAPAKKRDRGYLASLVKSHNSARNGEREERDPQTVQGTRGNLARMVADANLRRSETDGRSTNAKNSALAQAVERTNNGRA